MTPTGLKQRGPLTRLPCGCAHDPDRWIEFCDEHAAHVAAVQAAAAGKYSLGDEPATTPDPWS